MNRAGNEPPRISRAARRTLRLLLPADIATSLAQEIDAEARHRFDAPQQPGAEHASSDAPGLRERCWIWRQVLSPSTLRLRRSLRRRARAPRRPLTGLELRLAVRSLKATKSGPIVVVALAGATLACVIGMAFVRTVLLSPLPFSEPDRLAVVFSAVAPGTTTSFNSNSWGDYERIRTGTDSFEVVAAQLGYPFSLLADSGAEQIGGLRVTAGYFDLLGASASRGRLLNDGDHAADANPAVVLSNRFWRTRFGADEQILGRALRMEDLNMAAVEGAASTREFVVVGVADERFWAPRFWNDAYRTADLWVPFRQGLDMADDDMGVLDIVGRLAPGATPAVAQAEARALQTGAPGFDPDDPPSTVVVGAERQVVGGTGESLWRLLAAALLLVIVACTNTGILVGARASARREEFATLAALGAPGARVAGLVVVETLLLAGLGVAMGLAAAHLLLPAVVASLPTEVPRLDEVSLRAVDQLGAAATTLVTVLMFGAWPAWRSVRRRASGSRSGSRVSPANGGRALLAVQVALGAVLLVGTSSALRDFGSQRATPLGFATENRLVFGLRPPPSRYPDAADRIAFVDAVLAELRALTGVASVTLAQNLPLDLSWSAELVVDAPGTERDVHVGKRNAVAGDHATTLGMTLIAGRALADGDSAGSEPVVVLNRAATTALFADPDPVGRRVWIGGSERTIVGIVDSTAGSALGPPVMTAYLPVRQAIPGGYVVVLQTADRTGDEVLRRAREAVAAVDPQLPMLQPRRLRDHVDQYVARSRFLFASLSALAAVALVVVVVGSVGVAGVEATARLRELAIRQAVGANRRQALTCLLARPAAFVALGATAGPVLALWLERSLSAVVPPLAEARWIDVSTAAAIVAACTLVAAAIRFLRATRLNPAELLRG